MTAARPPILSEDLLKRFHERAPAYDRENRFFAEDFEELWKTDYLKMAVPREHGGLGMTLAECGRNLLGIHGLDASNSREPKIVHGFIALGIGLDDQPRWG